MKSLYLILATTAVVVTCKPQRSNNDIIWYPVDDEEGVFISTYGEKHRSVPTPKWRARRVRRYEPYDPTENHDPSFFNNINDRREYDSVPKLPPAFYNQQHPNKRPQAQGNQIRNNRNYEEIIIEVIDYTKTPSGNVHPGGRPTNQWNNRHQKQWGGNPFLGGGNQWGGQQRPAVNQWGSSAPLVSVYPVQRPVSNQWGGASGNFYPGQRPSNSNQWGSNSNSLGNNYPGQRPSSNSNQWGTTSGNEYPGQKPSTSNQWGSTSNSIGNNYPGQRPSTSNQWGTTSDNQYPGQRPGSTSNQWGTTSGNEYPGQQSGSSNQWGSNSVSRPFERPTSTEWIDNQDNTNRPIRPNKPTDQSDKLVFPDEFSEDILTPATTPSSTTATDLGPTDPPTRSPCENMCPVTPEFNPVCGTDAVTYSNAGRLKCAQMCGKDVSLSHYGNCGRTPFTTPLVSNNPLKDFRGFW